MAPGDVLRAHTYWSQSRAMLLKVLALNVMIIRRRSGVFYRALPTPFSLPMKHTLTFLAAMLLAPLAALCAADSPTIHSNELLAPRTSLKMKLKTAGQGKAEHFGNRWHISGESPLRIEFIPADQKAWDISGFRLVGVPMLNQESGVTTVEGRLNNDKFTGWSHHAVGFAVAPSAEKATLGFPFPVDEGRYKGPEVFKDQLAKPNGQRMHWRLFDPEDVRALTMEIKSSTGHIDLLIDDPFLAWPATAELDQKLEAMPYLDVLGQVRAVDWPGKAGSIKEAGAALWAELTAAAMQAKERKLGRFGGWLDGPKRKATGHFRTEKVDGQWWLVDPDGYLFFSVGVCLAGNKSETLITPKRTKAGFFEYLPDDKDYLRWVGRSMQGKQELANFPAMNYARLLGKDWESIDRDGIHNRLRAWGMNTLGAWTDEKMQKDARTPYTLIASSGWTVANPKQFPSPFGDTFEADVRAALQKFAWARDDPYCLGIFIDNELEWPDRFTPAVYEMDETDPTKQWVLATLKKRYGSLAELNEAWDTAFADWNGVLAAKPDSIPKAASDDIEPLYLDFTTTYFTKCKAAINDVLPHKLYLGCRAHRGPPVIGRGAAGHVDVFSVNVYDSHVRASQVPPDIDMPILAGEFHFGAVDRGVPGPGLCGSWDQRQRGLAFCNYLASALADPRFVGVHWFQWLDQSAAGRFDRENHQCGLVDVTGRSYPEFVELISRATRAMYTARTREKPTAEQILEQLIQK